MKLPIQTGVNETYNSNPTMNSPFRAVVIKPDNSNILYDRCVGSKSFNSHCTVRSKLR